jgi:hypothetical protein
MNYPNEIDRRAFRHDVADGLTEIAMALFFLVPALTLRNPAFSWMIILPILFIGPWLKRIRARTTYPRIGYVEPRGEKAGELLRGMAIYVLVVLAAAAVAIFIWRGQLTTDWVRRVAPLLASLFFGGGLLYAAGRSGLRRYYVLLVASIALGAVLTIYPAPGRYASVRIYLLVMGLIVFIVGLVTFAHFLKTHPVRGDAEEEDGC